MYTRTRSKMNQSVAVIREINSDDDDDPQLLDAKLDSLRIKCPDNASVAEKKRLLISHKNRRSMSDLNHQSQNQSNSHITSPIRDTVFPNDSTDEEPVVEEQEEKADDKKMKNLILRCPYPMLEAEKFAAAMKSTINTFEPYTDEDGDLEVLRKDYIDEDIDIMSWQCDELNPNMRHLHFLHIAEEMDQLAEMASKLRGIGPQRCANTDKDIAKQLRNMGICVQDVKYTAVVDYNKAQNVKSGSWVMDRLGYVFNRKANKQAPAAAVQNSKSNPQLDQATSSSNDPFIFIDDDDDDRDDNFNMNMSSKRGRGSRRRKLSRMSLSYVAAGKGKAGASTSSKTRKVGSLPYATSNSEEKEYIHCSGCKQDFALETMMQIPHLQKCFKDIKCPNCPQLEMDTWSSFSEHLAACFIRTSAHGGEHDDGIEDLRAHLARTRRGKRGGNERANSDSDQSIPQNSPPLKKTRTSDTQIA